MNEEVGGRLALAAGAGRLLAQVVHLDIGLGLVTGALVGSACVILLLGPDADDATPRE